MTNFQPLNDMILVKPDPLPEQIGSIAIPHGVLKPGHKPGPSGECFIGTVVAVGPGDRHLPGESVYCSVCHQKQHLDYVSYCYRCACVPSFHGATAVDSCREWDAGRHPMVTKVGDRVAYPRRPSAPGGEFSVKIDGEEYVMFHETQFAFAVVEA